MLACWLLCEKDQEGRKLWGEVDAQQVTEKVLEYPRFLSFSFSLSMEIVRKRRQGIVRGVVLNYDAEQWNREGVLGGEARAQEKGESLARKELVFSKVKICSLWSINYFYIKASRTVSPLFLSLLVLFPFFLLVPSFSCLLFLSLFLSRSF